MRLVILLIFCLYPTTCLAETWLVTRVIDGDTIRIQGHGLEVNARLAVIDTPETAKKRGKKPAKQSGPRE